MTSGNIHPMVKSMVHQANNPVNDCEKAYDLLMDEVAQWEALSGDRQNIYAALLQGTAEFEGFLNLVNATAADADALATLIRSTYEGQRLSHHQ